MKDVEFITLREEIWEDSRGFSFYPLKGRSGMGADLPEVFHLVSIAPGAIRGNHVHPGRLEWLYPFHGTGFFMWESQPGNLRERLVTGHRLLIRIPPGIPHALRNPGPETLYLLAWREGEREAEPETVPYILG